MNWVYVRDMPNSLTYMGQVNSYSEDAQMQELVLSNATVFTYPDSVKLYDVPLVYLAKPLGQFVIEVTSQQPTEE